MRHKTRLMTVFALVLAMTVIAACSPAAIDNGEPPDPDGDDGPVQGGTLIQASFTGPAHLNPHLFSPGGAGESHVGHVFRGLIAFDPDTGAAVPDLAASWTISDDDLEYTFVLRDDVTWHDGEPFTSRDVKFTYDAIKHPEYLGYRQSTHGDPIREIEIVDEHTVRFILEEAFAPFIMNLDFSITPEHVLGDAMGKGMEDHPFNSNPVGTGPFMFDKWVSGDRLELVAYDDFYLGRPNIDRLVYTIVPDVDAMVMAYEAGSSNLIFFDSRQLGIVEAIPNTRILQRPGIYMDTLFFNVNEPPLDDRSVRQALMHATDQDALLNALLQGNGVHIDSFILPESVFGTEDIAMYDFDKSKAEEILDEAGWTLNPSGIREKDGVTLSFELDTHTGNLRREATIQILQEQWQAIGIEVELGIYEVSTYWSERMLAHDYQVGVFGFAVPWDPDESSSQFVTGGVRNASGFANARVDELFALGRVTSEIDERAAYYKEIQEIVAEEVPYGFLSLRDLFTAMSDNIEGVELKPFGGRSDNDTFEYNIHEWWIRQ